jgi:hypothetical protein
MLVGRIFKVPLPIEPLHARWSELEALKANKHVKTLKLLIFDKAAD